ncbi:MULTISPECIES: metal-binding protein [unclassified Okeania]|uniref:metal-binding protein n=1 Tax=unclassified Okeania TaxID=2634635 RepID=UPI0013BE77C8|nr:MULTISPECIES: metal-binding protein [unclassified Okeania]NES79777.1 metal-binding protein [Okeania sp. SIO1H4]NET16879.1 metal-binding protein [Okeania sp. SIO1H6]NET23459.1 metal-binding protein [Okeania sp. SIO1H5]NET97214.1 metal-binding protein [Okeania sp. SIO1H2]
MPSGSTHDRITLWSLPIVTSLSFGLIRSTHLTLFVSGSFLFSGLMFGPDLDINSRQFQRWGWFKWLWRPYQTSLNHRSFLSHGPIIGTALRLLYILTWLGMVVVFGLIIDELLGLEWSILGFVESLWQSLSLHYQEVIALLVGLELGAMSHSVSDWSSSAYKRFKTKGLSSLIPKVKPHKQRRKSTPGKSTSPKVVPPRSRRTQK